MPKPAKYPPGGRAPSRLLGTLQWLDSYIETHVSQKLDELLDLAIARRRDATRPPPVVCIGPPETPLISGGGHFMIRMTVQVPFRPLRLVVEPSDASSFSIIEMRSGNVEWSAGIGVVPASAFVPPQFVPDVSSGELARLFNNLEGCPFIAPGQSFIVGVVNLTPGALRFPCCVFGETL